MKCATFFQCTIRKQRTQRLIILEVSLLGVEAARPPREVCVMNGQRLRLRKFEYPRLPLPPFTPLFENPTYSVQAL